MPGSPVPATLSQAASRLQTPRDYFSGLRVRELPSADNIVVFHRTSDRELRPLGVSHNYHHRYELVVPLSHDGTVHLDNASFPLEPGMGLLVFPHQFHHYLPGKGARLNWLFITFESPRPKLLEVLKDSPRRLAADDYALLHRLLSEWKAASKNPASGLQVVGLLHELLLRLCAAPLSKAPDIPQEMADSGEIAFQAINRYVREHLDKSPSLSDIARDTGYSTSYLRAVFKSGFGVSLGAYLRNSRLAQAASALAEAGGPSVEEVARSCGFDSLSAFSRAFKRSTGFSPREYRSLARHSTG